MRKHQRHVSPKKSIQSLAGNKIISERIFIMKIFVAGGTGVLGRRVVPQLLSLGYEVVALSRSRDNDDLLATLGAEARRGDLFDREGLYSLSADCDVIIHLATAIPTKSRTMIDDWVLNDRIRTEGTTNLLAAALRNSTRLYIQGSVTFLYGRRHGEWIDESCPPADNLPAMVKSSVEMERQVLDVISRYRLPAVILRFGNVYSHDSRNTTTMYDMISRGKFPLIERGNVYWNLVTADDAAAAVVSAVRNGRRHTGKVYNVCDDEPVKYKDLVEYISRSLGAPKPGSIPIFLAKQAIGDLTVQYLLQNMKCMNHRIKEDLGWQLRYPTYREGHEAIMERWRRQHGGTGTTGLHPPGV